MNEGLAVQTGSNIHHISAQGTHHTQEIWFTRAVWFKRFQAIKGAPAVGFIFLEQRRPSHKGRPNCGDLGAIGCPSWALELAPRN